MYSTHMYIRVYTHFLTAVHIHVLPYSFRPGASDGVPAATGH